MASSKACLVAALCCLVMFTTFISRADAASCCMRYTKRHLSCAKVFSYSIQTINSSCDISAIIFHLPGRFVCVDPSKKWAKNCMNSVEKRRKIAKILEEKQVSQ
ncbi:C-C motif chemokine 20b [Nothobranchius furzeri]|uniref:C-C motif chemokine 20-like n=1 Tax=Nothobranchius furzeri TaxID=105023 RepID=A0A8C6LSH6_NOTFU|nr:C-C motif chemokine 20b [Nothobranchius furzeri]KAF7214135.1 C-C motif chemokine 20-like [Nothobranchius furzeri]